MTGTNKKITSYGKQCRIRANNRSFAYLESTNGLEESKIFILNKLARYELMRSSSEFTRHVSETFTTVGHRLLGFLLEPRKSICDIGIIILAFCC